MPEVVHANCRLFDHVIMPYLHGAQQEIPYRTLCKLLPDLINGSSLASATTIALLRTRLPQLDGTEAVLGVLQSVAPALRWEGFPLWKHHVSTQACSEAQVLVRLLQSIVQSLRFLKCSCSLAGSAEAFP